jgi:MFS family permease
MLAIAVLALGTGVGQALLVWFPTLAIARLGVRMGDTAQLMLPLVIGGIVATLVIAAVLDRIGARRLLMVGAVAAVAGMLLALAAPPTRIAFMAGAGLFGLGVVGLCGGPLRYAAARAVPGAAQGPAQSAVALLTNIGLLAGSVLLGALAATRPSERTGVEAALLAGSALMGSSFVALLALAPHHAGPQERRGQATSDDPPSH